MSERRGGVSWVRRYPPLASFAVALLITFVVLPSALTLPNANPTTVLEYAPVPPEDDDPPPPQTGSLSNLGLGTSSSLTTGVSPDLPPVSVPVPGGTGTRPITKRCVGKPLRQTEDANAPPCVPHFEGDNGGATWQGVTKDEIVVMVYRSASLNTGGSQTPPTGTYCDVDKPPDSQTNCRDSINGVEDHSEVRVTRAMSKYFNERFQTYGRHVHFFIYWTASQSTPAGRRADAADNWETLKPFAVLDRAFFGGHNAIYAEAMVRRATSVFGNFGAVPNAYYREYAPYIWSFWPDVEHWAEMYSSYICQKVRSSPVQHSGNAGEVGKPRQYGLLYTTDTQYPGLQLYAKLVEAQIAKCGVTITEKAAFPRHQYQIDTHPEAPAAARANVAKFRAAGVTTVLWLGGYETEHTKAAAAANWFPEWIVGGDLLNDGLSNAQAQQQDVWKHAWVVSNFLREDKAADQACRQAFRESDPSARSADEEDACAVYRALFQLFKSIQVAGPELSPQTVDQGQHAIQRQSSPNPYVAACFYDPGDYTCVKDAHEAWWDPSAPDPEGDAGEFGCWRMVREGRRYLAGTWEGTTADLFANRSDPCNAVDTDTFANPYGPAG